MNKRKYIMFTMIIIGILMAVFGLIFLVPMLNLFGATENNLQYAIDYASIILIGIPFVLCGVGGSNFARTDGSPKIAMLSMVVGAVMNTILDPIFIFVFHWGVKGAAVATIMGQIATAIIIMRYFVKSGNMRFKKEYQRKGYGKKLIEHSFNKAAELGYDVVVIFGSPSNYVSSGFKSCKKFNVCLEGGIYPAAMMVKELKEGALDGRKQFYYDSSVMQIDEKEA